MRSLCTRLVAFSVEFLLTALFVLSVQAGWRYVWGRSPWESPITAAVALAFIYGVLFWVHESTHRSVILDRFANWFCSQMWVWGWAEKRGSRLAVRTCRLCMARGVGVSIRWVHLVGKLDLNDALAASALEKVTAWQKVAIGVMGSADVEAVMPLDRATDRWVVPVADWFFNGTADAPGEAVGQPPTKPDEKVQIGPLDV